MNKALSAIFLKDEMTRASCAMKNFVEFRRESGNGFAKFLVEFNNRVRKVKKYKLVLDDGLMAYFLLTTANLSDDHEKLVRATASLNSDDMKDKLQKVFGQFDGNDEDTQTGTLPVKEQCLLTKGYNQRRSSRGGCSGHKGGWSQQNSSRGFGQNQDSGQRGDQYSSQGGHIIAVKDVLVWVEVNVSITQTHLMWKAISCGATNATAQNISWMIVLTGMLRMAKWLSILH